MRDLSYAMEVAQDQENDSIKKSINDLPIDTPVSHPLEHEWTLWYYDNNKNKDWLENLHEVYTFSTVEDFWCLFNHIKPVTSLSAGNDYSLFKKGIRPMWEDDHNKKGGRWLLNMDGRMNRNDLHDLWLNLLLFMIGESFDEFSDEICGAFVNVRKLDKISLWTANADKRNEILEIGKKLKFECLRLPQEMKVIYETHLDSQNKTGSRAKYLHVV
ncbi:eukaryotic translation initiation factor 4E-like [Planococcus citri]|uniref:eukaryotic translation initiation factor 4E-like n=1 Tax=Planococcus citri TaxID=170843 RepID=UPI0031F96114